MKIIEEFNAFKDFLYLFIVHEFIKFVLFIIYTLDLMFCILITFYVRVKKKIVIIFCVLDK